MLQRPRLVGEWSEVLLKPTIGGPWLIAGPAGGLLVVYMALSLRGERTVKAKVESRGKRGCIKVVEEGAVPIALPGGHETTWSCIRTLTLPLQNRNWNSEISDRGGDQGISLAWEILYQISR